MDFGTWNPSHTILALFIAVGFAGPVAVLFYQMKRLEKQIDRNNAEIQQLRAQHENPKATNRNQPNRPELN